MSQNHISNLDKVFLNVPPSSDFGFEARILQIGWFYRPKWKKVEKSASKNKHPIKLRFLIWRLQSANPEKKVIPENQGFGSCPFNKEFRKWYYGKVVYPFPAPTSLRNLIRIFKENIETQNTCFWMTLPWMLNYFTPVLWEKIFGQVPWCTGITLSKTFCWTGASTGGLVVK